MSLPEVPFGAAAYNAFVDSDVDSDWPHWSALSEATQAQWRHVEREVRDLAEACEKTHVDDVRENLKPYDECPVCDGHLGELESVRAQRDALQNAEAERPKRELIGVEYAVRGDFPFSDAATRFATPEGARAYARVLRDRTTGVKIVKLTRYRIVK